MFGYIDKISSHLHDYCMKAVLLEGQTTNLIFLPCLSFYFQNPIVLILTLFDFFALAKPFHGTGWAIWLHSQVQTQWEYWMWICQGWGLLWLEVSFSIFALPKLCWTIQVGGRRRNRNGKYGAVVYCRESLGKAEDNLLGICRPTTEWLLWLQLLHRAGAGRREEIPQHWTASPCSKYKLL